MPEVDITKRTVNVVGVVGTNQYGDLTWTDDEGKSYKVKAARKQYFEAIVPGQAVEISWSTYKGTEYPYSAVAVKDKIAEQPEVKVRLPQERHPDEMPDSQTPQSKSSPTKAPVGILSREVQIERSVWWKEVGECLRSRLIEPDSLYGRVLTKAYYAEMFRVLGINVKEVQPAKSHLVEEAKRLVAQEVEPGSIPF